MPGANLCSEVQFMTSGAAETSPPAPPSPPPPPPPPPPPTTPQTRGGRGRFLLAGLVLVVVGALIVGALSRGGESDDIDGVAISSSQMEDEMVQAGREFLERGATKAGGALLPTDLTADCQSNSAGPDGKTNPFTCLVKAVSDADRSGIDMYYVIYEVEDGCWRGLVTAIDFNDGAGPVDVRSKEPSEAPFLEYADPDNLGDKYKADGCI